MFLSATVPLVDSMAMMSRLVEEDPSTELLRIMRSHTESELSFAQLVERLQHDDRAAVGLVVERYGDALRRAIERALLVRRLNASSRASDEPEASDVFQTVMLLFLARLQRQAGWNRRPAALRDAGTVGGVPQGHRGA